MDKYLFVHIPKNGGTTITKYIKHKKNVKLAIHKILKYENPIDSIKFTFVRNPVKRAISMFTYSKKKINELKKNGKLSTFQYGNWKKLNDMYVKYKITNINNFIEKLPILFENEIKPEYDNLKNLNPERIYCYYKVLFFPQTWFICDDEKNILVDKIFKTENINEVLKKIFNINVEKKYNVSNKEEITLSEKEKQIILFVYKEDYDILNKYF